MTILFIVPVWGRPEILKSCIKGVKNVQDKVKHITIKALYIVSPTDKMFNANKEILYQSKYIIHENFPLGKKMNAGIKYALKNIEFDYMCNLGSDDIINPVLFRIYEPFIAKKCLFFGFNNIYIFDIIDNKLYFFCYTGTYQPNGAGRMIHKSILKKLKGSVYVDEDNRSLDACSAIRIKEKLNVDPVIIDLLDFPATLTLKSRENLNPTYRIGYLHLKIVSEEKKKKIFKTFNYEK